MDRKLIFLDIDGTLITAMSEPSALTVKAVRRVRENGHRYFYAPEEIWLLLEGIFWMWALTG